MAQSLRQPVTAAWWLVPLLLVGCGSAPDGWTPVMEETSTTFLRTETQAVASEISQAKADLLADPEKAAKELAAAEDRLDHLLTYYLPLLEAREYAYNAYRHHILGDSAQTARELAHVESILIAVAESGHGHLLREMEEPLEALEDARVELRADGREAAKSLKYLATRLNFLLLKGGLVLAE